MDYTEQRFRAPKGWIYTARNNNITWDDIRTGRTGCDQGLITFLHNQVYNNFWDVSVTPDVWKGLVDYLHAEDDRLNAPTGSATLYRRYQNNDVIIPNWPNSSWQKYKNRLLNEKHYPQSSVDELEQSVFNTLRRLSDDTTQMDYAIKGMVVGSVQSGKTSHMAGLIAMAADNGWNMFVVLSGLLENLRLQTETRLIQDLPNGNNSWLFLHPGTRNNQPINLLRLGNNAPERYVTVCLKNPVRLKHLINYLQSNSDQQEQMKVLVIEDEADQAGVNTMDTNYQRKALDLVNKLNLSPNVNVQDIVDKFAEIATSDDENLINADCFQLSQDLPIGRNVNRSDLNGKLSELFSGLNDPTQRKALAKSINNMLDRCIDGNTNRAKSIDRELEQLASIRTSINEYLTKLVSGKKPNGAIPQHPNGDIIKFKAMNYIAYTATPFANLLNEAPSPESLYPGDFVIPLKPSNEYFGPQQIFGYQTTQAVVYPGLDIVRNINDFELHQIKEINEGKNAGMPMVLMRSLMWFFCCAACWRYWGEREPISMLIHTSHLTGHHENLAKWLEKWFNLSDPSEINIIRTLFILLCRCEWDKERHSFTKATLRKQFHDYGIADADIRNLPTFDQLLPYFDELFPENCLVLNRLTLDPTLGELTYCTSGINLCIDNSEETARIKYPSTQLQQAPVFIVIGGATLSRGLTFKGLVCSYFSRQVNQLDTMLQMGRWFGYRKGYELLPRIWMSTATKQNFEEITVIDQELRDEIWNIYATGQAPAEVGVRVKNCAKMKILTARNKMQAAVAVSMDFTGTANQTIMFNNNAQELQGNLDLTTTLLTDLGQPSIINSRSNNTHVWKDIDFANVIRPFLQQFHFCNRMRAFGQVDLLIQWVERITQENQIKNWNIVLAGKNNPNNLFAQGTSFEIGKINRSRLDDARNDVININGLITTSDILNDVDLTENSQMANEVQTANAGHKEIRSRATQNGVSMVEIPQMLIYVIDKDSQRERNEPNRRNLDSPVDIVGLNVYIPGNSATRGRPTVLNINLN